MSETLRLEGGEIVLFGVVASWVISCMAFVVMVMTALVTGSLKAEMVGPGIAYAGFLLACAGFLSPLGKAFDTRHPRYARHLCSALKKAFAR